MKEKEEIEIDQQIQKEISPSKTPKNKKITKSIVKENYSENKIPTGFLLEYRVKRLLFYMGYFAKNGVIMKTSHDENAVIITDLDVLGIYIHKDFTSKTIWADCKSGRAKVHERISWIKGIMNTLDINDTIFVKPGVRIEVKKYAKKSHIQIMDVNIIDKLEKDYNINQEDWSGSWDYKIQFNLGNTFSKIRVPSNDLYKRIYNFHEC